MITYKTTLTIEDPSRLVLSDLPFPAGQRVEVIVTADERTARVQQLKELLRITQALPQAQRMSEEQIRAEVEAYRNQR